MDAELLKNCLFCRRDRLELKTSVNPDGKEGKDETTVLKWKSEALKSVCRLFYLAPEDTWINILEQGVFCSDCQFCIWEVHSSFKIIDKLQSKIADLRTNLNERLEKNCRFFRKPRFFDDEITPYGSTVNTCYEG